MELAVTALHDFQLDLHVVAFQEVGGAIARDESTTDGITMLELDGLAVLVAKPDGCFRPVALGLDADCFDAWGNGHVGHSHLCCTVRIPSFTQPTCIACVHLPHHGRPVDDFLAALASLELCLRPSARKGHPILVLGDLNVDLCRGSGTRFTALHACLHGLGLVHFSSDLAPTWGTHRLDHVVCNRAVVERCAAFPLQEACQWAAVAIRSDLRDALSADHCLVLHELLLSTPRHLSGQKRASRSRAFMDRPCKMQVAQSSLLQQKVYGFLDSASRGPVPDPHAFLAECAATCCSRAPGLRFRDSAALRALCRSRSLCSDDQTRRGLSLSIHLHRKAEKKLWRQSLVDRASRGDWRARRFLQRKAAGSPALVAQSLVRIFGSRDAAVEHVRDHFCQRFAGPDDLPLSFDDLPVAEPEFTEHEVSCAVSHMKTGKTTGMSKVSVELLRSLVALPLGLDSLLRNPSDSNLELASGWVILVPKTLWPQDAKGFRPIVCGEVLAKLAARLATSRLVSHWSVPAWICPRARPRRSIVHCQACSPGFRRLASWSHLCST